MVKSHTRFHERFPAKMESCQKFIVFHSLLMFLTCIAQNKDDDDRNKSNSDNVETFAAFVIFWSPLAWKLSSKCHPLHGNCLQIVTLFPDFPKFFDPLYGNFRISSTPCMENVLKKWPPGAAHPRIAKYIKCPPRECPPLESADKYNLGQPR